MKGILDVDIAKGVLTENEAQELMHQVGCCNGPKAIMEWFPSASEILISFEFQRYHRKSCPSSRGSADELAAEWSSCARKSSIRKSSI